MKIMNRDLIGLVLSFSVVLGGMALRVAEVLPQVL